MNYKMGKSNKFDDDDSHRKNSRGPKHSRNTRGVGMRVINSWYDEDDDDIFEDDIFEDELEIADEVEIVLHTNIQR